MVADPPSFVVRRGARSSARPPDGNTRMVTADGMDVLAIVAQINTSRLVLGHAEHARLFAS